MYLYTFLCTIVDGELSNFTLVDVGKGMSSIKDTQVSFLRLVQISFPKGDKQLLPCAAPVTHLSNSVNCYLKLQGYMENRGEFAY